MLPRKEKFKKSDTRKQNGIRFGAECFICKNNLKKFSFSIYKSIVVVDSKEGQGWRNGEPHIKQIPMPALYLADATTNSTCPINPPQFAYTGAIKNSCTTHNYIPPYDLYKSDWQKINKHTTPHIPATNNWQHSNRLIPETTTFILFSFHCERMLQQNANAWRHKNIDEHDKACVFHEIVY